MAAQIREVEHSRQEVVRSVLEVGFPWKSQSSIQIHWFLLLPGPTFYLSALRKLIVLMFHLFCLNSLTCPSVGRAGKGEFTRWAVPSICQFVSFWRVGAWPRQTLKHPRHIYFSWIKLSLRQCQTQKRALRHLEAGKGLTGKRISPWEFDLLEHSVIFLVGIWEHISPLLSSWPGDLLCQPGSWLSFSAK